MSDNNSFSSKKIKGIFEDLWGELSDTVSSAEHISKKKNESINNTEKSAPSVDPDYIHLLLKDMEKNLQNDKMDLPPEKTSPAGLQTNDAKKPTESSVDTSSAASSANEEKAPEEETDPMEDLEALIGLKDLKKDVADLISLVKMQKLRKDQGLKAVPVSLHLVFSGNPGTGKTTVARILGRLYKQIGVLSKGQLVEVDRSSLVAGFVGQTATKTQEKISEAMGGILFIDEAYTLAKEGGNDFGQEAIDTLLKAMEDHREDFVVIVAGYPDLMEQFIGSNPGLKSRFNKYLTFSDYSVEELTDIFMGFCEKYQYHIAEDAKATVSEMIEKMSSEKNENFANAREVRNLFEKIITRQATRISKMEGTPDKECITEIIEADIKEADDNND